MDKEKVLEKMVDICRDVFEDDSLIITEDTCSADVEKWDSLTHITLVNELEETFGITFTLEEVSSSDSLGKLANAIVKHCEIE